MGIDHNRRGQDLHHIGSVIRVALEGVVDEVPQGRGVGGVNRSEDRVPLHDLHHQSRQIL